MLRRAVAAGLMCAMGSAWAGGVPTAGLGEIEVTAG